MAINIQSLFADIISTPEQREDKLLKEGMLQGQLLASGLKGRAAALSPLAQIAGQYGVQRQENLKRAVQPMLGIDPRSSEERLQETLAGMDLNSPTGLRDAALAIQSVDPLRAATLRQAALEMQRETTDRERIAEDRLRTQERQDEADARSKRQLELSEKSDKRAEKKQDISLTTSRLNNQRIQQGIDATQNALEENEANQVVYDNQLTTLRNSLSDNDPIKSMLVGRTIPISTLINIGSAKNKSDSIQIKKFYDSATNSYYLKGVNTQNGDIEYTIPTGESETISLGNTSKDLRENYEETIDDNDKLKQIYEGTWRGDPLISKLGLVDLLHRMSTAYGNQVQAEQTLIEMAGNNEGIQDIKAGRFSVEEGEWSIVND